MAPTMHDARAPIPHNSHPISSRSKSEDDDRISLFGDIPESKKRKFIIVDDPAKNQRVRVRVTLDAVDTDEIPDSFRKSNAVYPRSWFPMQMQDPPPAGHGTRFFDGDDDDDTNPRGRRGRTMVPVPLADGAAAEVGTPRMRRSLRGKEIRINELGYRMAWHQSRVFNGKSVFLQKAREFPLSGHGIGWRLMVFSSGHVPRQDALLHRAARPGCQPDAALRDACGQEALE
jgi:hypothetical protein